MGELVPILWDKIAECEKYDERYVEVDTCWVNYGILKKN